jgi:hypothetical protein
MTAMDCDVELQYKRHGQAPFEVGDLVPSGVIDDTGKAHFFEGVGSIREIVERFEVAPRPNLWIVRVKIYPPCR